MPDTSRNFTPCKCGGGELDIVIRLIYKAMTGDVYLVECSNCGKARVFIHRGSPYSIHEETATVWNKP